MADRPNIPASYGLEPAAAGSLASWSTVVEKLVAAHNYWVVTADDRGRPHAAPVWGLWHEGAFIFATDPLSRKGRNISHNPSVVIHLESGDDVVILEGTIETVNRADRLEEIASAYRAKYDVGVDSGQVYAVRPQKAFAWSEAEFPASATRWKLPLPE
jgi:pyridoxine/pyridoxamine 5'-phosphate oxidase